MANDSGRCIIVAGASGFVGGAAIAQLARDGWDVVGVSRRAPVEPVPGVEYVSLDLLDPVACRTAARSLSRVTHMVYAAVNETPGSLVASWSDPTHAERNGRMFANLLDAFVESAPGLSHVSLVHGTKAYAPHHPGRLAVPLKESMPRPDFDDFYFRQEDHLWAAAKAGKLSWTVFRAQIIVGGGRGSNLNGMLALCVLASLRRAVGLDLPLPGAGATDAVIEMTDVELLARGIAWAATAPTACNEIFNITNGDVFTWRDLWPAIAGEIGLPVGEHVPFSVVEEISARAADWAELVRKNGMTVPEDPMEYLGESAALSDFALAADRNVITSTVKIRQAGFHVFEDSAESVVRWIRRWRAEGLLPPK